MKIQGKDELTLKLKSIYGNKYGYEFIDDDLNPTRKIKILCYEHGLFRCSIQKLLNKEACPKCVKCIDGKKRLQAKKDNIDLKQFSFIAKAQQIHGQKYDYSLVKYEGINQKVKILCSIHGQFEQSPSMHINGYGCPLCVNRRIVKTNMFQCNLYLIKFKKLDILFWKIGISIHDIEKRFPRHHRYAIEIYTWTLPRYIAFQVEQNILLSFKQFKFDSSNYRNIFLDAGKTECFTNKLPLEKVKKAINRTILQKNKDSSLSFDNHF